MAHELAETNGRTAMMYVGDAPWHRLGTKLDAPATASEAIVAAGLDYEVQLDSLTTVEGTPVPQRKAVARSDSKDILGVVGNNYVPIQNWEAFQFLDTVVAEGELRYHTAGALGKGERVWMLAKLPGHIRVKGSDDISEKFLLLSNSHNGTSALRVFFTPIRVVCANTLSIAEQRGLSQGVSILHKGDLGAKVREAQKVLGLAVRFYDDVQLKIDRLASYYPTRGELTSYFKMLYPNPVEGNKTRAQNIRQELFRLFEEGKGQDIDEIRHSAWAAVNSVSEYIDHHRTTRSSNGGDRDSHRLNSAWFGSGARIKSRAWDLALDLVASN